MAFAHRGASAHAPENTLDAFRLAVRLGAWGVETDVWRTADGEAVLDHAGVARVGRRRRPISELRRDQLPAHIPTLAELYDAIGTGLEVSIDLKDPAAVGAVVTTARNAGGDAEANLWLCHGEWATLLMLRAASASAKVVDSARLARVKEGPERRAAALAQAGIDAFNLHHTEWNGGLVALLHRFGRLALAWDLQHDHLLRTSVRMGIDGVYSDWVDRMVDALGAEC